MKKLMFALIGALTAGLLFGDTFTWKGGTGAFTDTAMWEEGSAPTSGADLVFPSGDNVVTDIGTFEVNAIALNGATELQFGSAGGTFKVNGVISGSGSLKSVGNAAAESHVELRGDNTFTGGYTNWGGDTLVYHANALGTGKAVFQSNGKPGCPLKAYTSNPIPNEIDVSHEYPWNGSIQAGNNGATFNGKVNAVANKIKADAKYFRLKGTITFNNEVNFGGNYGIVSEGNQTYNKAMTGTSHYLAINSAGPSIKLNASGNELSSIQWDNGWGYIYLNAENVFASPKRIVFADNSQANSGGLYVNASQVVEDISQNYEPNGSCSVVGGADPVTVTMQATANRTFSGKFTGDISLVWDPTGDFTYTVKGTTKSPGESTTIGGIAVNRGTFQVSEGASFAKITKVGVKAGATLAFAAGCACGTELTELKLQEGASFTIADGASLYVSKFITVDADGNETVMPKAVYTSADCPALGEGITVFPVASDLAYVGADGGDLCDKDNWEGGVAPTIYDIGVIPAGITSLTVSGPLTSGGLTFNGTDAVAITGEGKLALPDTGDFKLTSSAELTISVEVAGKARIVSKGEGGVAFDYNNQNFSGGIYRETTSASDAKSHGNLKIYKVGGLGTGDVYLKGNTGLVVGEAMIVPNNITFEQSVNNYYAQLVSNPSGTEFTGKLDFSKAICPRASSLGSLTYHDLVLKQGATHSWEVMLIAKSNTHYFKGHISGKGIIGSDTYSAWTFCTSLNDLGALDFYGLNTSSTCWADVKDIFTADTQVWMYTGAGATAQSFNLEGYDQTVESVFDKGGTVATSVHKHYISNAVGKAPATITMKGTANRTYTGLFSGSLSFTWEPTGDYTYTINGAVNSMNGKLWAKKGTIAVEGATDFGKVSEIEVGEDAAITFAEGTTLSSLLKKLTLGKNAALTVTDDVKAEEVFVTDSEGTVSQLQAGSYTVPGVTGGKVVVTKHIEEPTVEVTWVNGGDGTFQDELDWDGTPEFDKENTVATFATAGATATTDENVNLKGIVFNAPNDFAVNGAGSIMLCEAGISTADNFNYSIYNPLMIGAPQTWDIASGYMEIYGNLNGIADRTASIDTVDGAAGYLHFRAQGGDFAGDIDLRNKETTVYNHGVGDSTEGMVRIHDEKSTGTSSATKFYMNNATIRKDIMIIGSPTDGWGGGSTFVGYGTNHLYGTVYYSNNYARITAGTGAEIHYHNGIKVCTSAAGGFTRQIVPRGWGKQFMDGPMEVYGVTGDGEHELHLNCTGNKCSGTWAMTSASAKLVIDVDNPIETCGAFQFQTGGTVDLNGHELTLGGVIYAGIGGIVTSSEPAQLKVTSSANNIYSIFTGKAGLTFVGGGKYINFYGYTNSVGEVVANTTTGKIIVDAGQLAINGGVAYSTFPNLSEVHVSNGGRVYLKHNLAIGRRTDVYANGGDISVDAGVVQTVRNLYLDGSETPCQAGLWGKEGNEQADFTSPRFIGEGLLRVRGGGGVLIYVK